MASISKGLPYCANLKHDLYKFDTSVSNNPFTNACVMTRFRMGHLIEVNAHSLFSKYFSESGKLVSQLFSKIMEYVEESDKVVFVLIDEVESLAAARKAAIAGNEPTDAIRAVNALLTHLDCLRHHRNAMILCTSNLPEAVDAAFVDRADIKVLLAFFFQSTSKNIVFC